MQITTDRKTLARALATVARAANRKASIPALANVRLAVACGDAGTQGELTLTTTDLYRIAEIAIPAHAISDDSAIAGSTAIDAKRLADTIAKMAGDTVTIVADANRATVTSAGASVVLPVGPVLDDEIPTEPTLRALLSSASYTVPVAALREALSVSYCASTDDVRPHLSGVLLEIGNGKVRGVATDGHRLALTDAAAEIEAHTALPFELVSALIPAAAVADWIKALPKGAEETCEIAIVMGTPAPAEEMKRAIRGKAAAPEQIPTHAALLLGSTTLAVKLGTETFPPYAKVIPQGHPSAYRLDTASLLGAVERSLVSVGKAGNIVLAIGDAGLTVVSISPEGETREAVAFDDESSKAKRGCEKIGVNARYLLDVLKRAASSIVLSLAGDLDPLVIRDGGEGVAVIMPCRI